MVKVSRHFASETKSLDEDTHDAGVVASLNVVNHEKRKRRLGNGTVHSLSILQCEALATDLCRGVREVLTETSTNLPVRTKTNSSLG